MLILTRRIGESVVIGENEGNQVRVGIGAPKVIPPMVRAKYCVSRTTLPLPNSMNADGIGRAATSGDRQPDS